MSCNHRVRIAVGTAITTALTATGIALVAGTSAVQANPVCYGAGVFGTVTGTHDVPTTCVPTNLPVVCTAPSAGLAPTIGVHALVCVPV